jgi:hypothetical protein
VDSPESRDTDSGNAAFPRPASRWDRLFTDFEAELDAVADAEFVVEVADRTRREFAAVHLTDRLRAAVKRQLAVAVDVGGGLTVAGVLSEVGPDWMMLSTEIGGARILIPTEAVLMLRNLPPIAYAAGSEGIVAERFDVRMVLRRLARDRAVAAVVLRSGETVQGTLDRVGADFLDLATHDVDQPRRSAAVRDLRTIALRGIALLRIQ